jgi:type III pantothenate kinase
MKLLIDFGNTRCKWVSIVENEWQSVNSFAHHGQNICDMMRERLPLKQADEIHIVSVLGDEFEADCQQLLERTVPCNFYHSQSHAHSIRLAYAKPASYGADRFAALVAAHQYISGDKIIVDCGTALTVDVLKQSGEHLGGLIIPGMTMMCDSLCKQTANLMIDENPTEARLLAGNTKEAIYSGTVMLANYGLLGIIQQLQEDLDQAKIILTGGEANKMFTLDSIDINHKPNLVLEGLEFMVASGSVN